MTRVLLQYNTLTGIKEGKKRRIRKVVMEFSSVPQTNIFYHST